MGTLRLIARLDIKAPNLIKGIRLEGVRVIGDPHDHAMRYYAAGADEIVYMDAVASLYGRNGLAPLVSATARDVFIPITVGGGLRSVEDVHAMLRAGADKVAINTAAIADPSLINGVARSFGAQCMVLSIEAKQVTPGRWEAYTNGGRERSGRDVVEWARQAVDLGAGEILLTSVDRDGTRKGFDVELVRAVATAVPIPVVASGGMGSVDHLLSVVRDGAADAVAMGSVLHYRTLELPAVRAAAQAAGFAVRRWP